MTTQDTQPTTRPVTRVREYPGFVSLTRLRAESGVNRKLLEERLRSLGISTYSDPDDRRRRMIREADARLLTEPLEVTRRTPRPVPTGRPVKVG